MKLGVLVYIEQNHQVLMIHRKKQDEHQGFWLAPGGKIERNESPYEAAQREVEEETGLQVQELKLKQVLSFPDQGESPFGDEWMVFVFYTQQIKGTLSDTCPEGLLQWIDRDQLTSLPMWEGDRLFTPKIFEPGVVLGKMDYCKEVLRSVVFWEG